MNEKFLEQFYENVILPRYSTTADFGAITWHDHTQVGEDARAHRFRSQDGSEYVLLWEDFPGDIYFGDGITHETIPLNGELSIALQFADKKEIIDVTGYFTLFREKTPFS